MRKKLLKESDINRIVKKILRESKILVEQAFISKFLGSAGDDLIRMFGKESIEAFGQVLSKALNNQRVTFFSGGKQYLRSASGSNIEVDTIEAVLKAIQQGKMTVDDASRYFPRQLADGTELRQSFISTFSKKVGSTVSSIPSWVKSKWFVTTNTNSNIAKLFEKLHKLKDTKFDPKSVKVTNRADIHGREVLELKLPTGDDVLLYKSTGTGAPELKQAGDWQLINGFQPAVDNPNDVRWFIKNIETTQLTKGLNKYATELSNFVKTNGWQSLGR